MIKPVLLTFLAIAIFAAIIVFGLLKTEDEIAKPSSIPSSNSSVATNNTPANLPVPQQTISIPPTPATPTESVITNSPSVSSNAVSSSATETNAPAAAEAQTNPVVVTPPAKPVEAKPEPSAMTPPLGDHPAVAESSESSEVRSAIPLETSVIVLGYHQFTAAGVASSNPYVMSADVFESEMEYLKTHGYHVVAMSDLIRFLKKEIGLPRKSVVITIDDGYKSVCTHAYPILKKYGYPWTFFCYTDFVNSSSGSVSWKDLQQLQAEGVDIECHTKSHPFLTKKAGRSDEQYEQFLHDELAVSKQILEEKLKKKITCLAYSYGDWNKLVQQKAVAAGYEAIFTVASTPVTPSSPLDNLGRYIITKPEERMFATYLRQDALTLGSPTPAPASTIKDHRPVLSATLSYDGTINPKSIQAEVSSIGRVPVQYDASTQKVTVTLPRDLSERRVHVRIHIEDEETHAGHDAGWHFFTDLPEEPVTAKTPKAVPTPATMDGIPVRRALPVNSKH